MYNLFFFSLVAERTIHFPLFAKNIYFAKNNVAFSELPNGAPLITDFILCTCSPLNSYRMLYMCKY